MAVCTKCKIRDSAMFMAFCNECLRAPVDYTEDSHTEGDSIARDQPDRLQSRQDSQMVSEGRMVSKIGTAIIWLSLIASVICVLAFARVEADYGAYGKKVELNSFLVSIYAAAGLNGMFFGYLLSKVGSILTILERRNAS